MTALRLAFIGEGARPVRSVPRHAHAFAIVIWYTRGLGEVGFDDGRIIPFARDRVLCIPAGVAYGESSVRGFISLYCALEHLPLPAVQVACVADDPRFRLSARLLLEESRRCAGDQRLVMPALSAFRHCLTRLLAPAQMSQSLARMLELIHALSDDPLFGIASGCRRLGLGQRSVRVAFQRELGTTPLQYLLGWRIAQAQRILRGSGFPIQDVALRSGFSDPYYFARVFRRFTGLAPSAYRAAHAVPGR